MAVQDTEWAYTVDLVASPKAVLVALAFCRNGKTGRCFPSQQELASMTGLSIATVKRSLGDLVSAGIITRTKTVKGGYRSNDEYALNHDYEPAQVPVTMSAAHSEPRSPRQKVGLTVHKSGAHHERAVEPTGIKQEVNRKVGAAKRGSRIPDDFEVTPTMIAWAREHTPLVDGKAATAKFIDHWRSSTGRNATKLDWVAAWRNWLRTDQESLERTQRRTTTQRPTPTDRARAILALVPQQPQKEIS